MPEKIGVQVFIDTSQLNKGVAAYENALDRLTSATRNALPKLSFEDAFSNLQKVQKDLDALTGILKNTQSISSDLNSAFSGIAQSLNKFSSQIDSSVKQTQKLNSNLSNLSDLSQGSAFSGLQQFTSQIVAMGNAMSNAASSAKSLSSATQSIKAPPSISTVKPVATPSASVSTKPQQLSLGLISPQVSQIAQTAPAAAQAIQSVSKAVSQTGQAATAAAQPLKLVLNTVTQTAQAAPTAAKAVQSLSNTISQTAQVAPAAAQALNTVANAAKQTAQNVAQAATQTSSSTKSVGNSFENLGLRVAAGVAVGNAAIQAFKLVLEGIVNFSKETLNAVGFWERLTLSVEFYTAQAKQASGDTREFSEILNSVGSETQETITWLQQLAVQSPFTAQQVATVYRVAQAYGLTQDAATNLLPKLLDLAAAGGLDADVLQRIALALGQVEARGKLTGEEIRQLGNAGIPIRRLLVESLGIANSEFENLVEQGVFTADVVIPLITKSLESFDGAAKRVSTETISGLINSLTEIRQITEAKLFGGLFEQLQPQLQKIVEAFSDPAIPALLEEVGKQIGAAFATIIQSISNFVTRLVDAWYSLDETTRQSIIVFVTATAALTGFGFAVLAVTSIVTALINPITVLAASVAGLITWWTRGSLALSDFQEEAVKMTAYVTGATKFWAYSLQAPIKDITESFGDVNTAVEGTADAISEGAKASVEVVTDTADGISDVLSGISDDAQEYGAETMKFWAYGFESQVRIVSSVISSLGDIVASQMAPASPPPFLSEIEEWGQETMQLYLNSFTKADFDIIQDISRTIEDLLTSDLLSGGQEFDITSAVISSREQLTRAIAEISEFGSVSESTLDAVRTAAGSAGDEIDQYLRVYSQVAQTTREEIRLQNELNQVRSRYEGILSGLNDQLQKVSEQERQGDEQSRIAELQRVINRVGSQSGQGLSAQAEINRISIEQQIRSVEQQKKVEEDALNTQLAGAKSASEAAQKELEDLQARFKFQSETYELQLNYNQAIESYRKELESIAKNQVLDNSKKALEDSLTFIRLQNSEIRDNEELFRANLVLNDANATAAERAAAALSIQQIEVERQIRDLEAAELGKNLDDIRNIVITLDDIQSRASNLVGTSMGEANAELLKSLEILRLQRDELSDIQAIYAAQDIIKDPFSSQNQKALAANSISQIDANRKLRDEEAARLGINLDYIRSQTEVISTAQLYKNNLNDQLEISRLQSEELADAQKLYEINKILIGDSNKEATDFEIITAANEKKQIELNRAIRDQQAAILGIDLSLFRDVKIAPEDEPFAGVQDAVEKIKISIEGIVTAAEAARVKVNEFVATLKTQFENLNDALPSWLKLWSEDGNSPAAQFAIITTAVFGLSAAFNTLYTTLSLIGAIKGIGWLITLIGGKAIGSAVAGGAAAGAGGAAAGAGGAAAGAGGAAAAGGGLLAGVAGGAIVGTSIYAGVGIYKTLTAESNDYEKQLEKVKILEEEINKIRSETIGQPEGIITPIDNLSGKAISPRFDTESVSSYVEFIEKTRNLSNELVTAQKELSNIIAQQGDETGAFKTAADYFLWRPFLKSFFEKYQTNDVKKKAEEEVGTPVAEGIGAGFTNWIKKEWDENIQWIIDGTKSLLGIQSPSTVMENEVGIPIAEGIMQGITNFDIVTSIKEFFSNIIGKFKEFFGISSPSTVMRDEIGIAIGDGLLSGISQSISDGLNLIQESITSLISDVKSGDKLLEWFDSAKEIGSNIMLGIKQGIDDWTEEIKLSLTSLVTSLPEWAKKILGIASPSKVFQDEIGKPIAQGISEGITKEKPEDLLGATIDEVIGKFDQLKVDSVEILSKMNEMIIEDNLLLNETLVENFENFTYQMAGTGTSLVSIFAVKFVEGFEAARIGVSNKMNQISSDVIQSFGSESGGLIYQLSQSYTKLNTTNPAYKFGQDFMLAIGAGMNSQSNNLSATFAKIIWNILYPGQTIPQNRNASANPASIITNAVVTATGQINSSGAVRASGAVTITGTVVIPSGLNAASKSSQIFQSIPSQIASSVINNNYVSNYNLTVYSTQTSDSIRQDFKSMELMAL